ncbi:ion channel [Hydromonas duriensis]|uniref:Inward rectifier potassium channel n=1 Tax=Hydromonas duriensis TaxID=1527608 RepID=A0A4R6YAE5_9BURK|nr:ion channel [Hydromonas duriensis]TDR32540.1 inward rectifier potassium channel [Hydromonas duriensis]
MAEPNGAESKTHMNSHTVKKKKVRSRVLTVGSRQVVIHGNKTPLWHDLYHYALSATWTQFFTVFTLLFVLINLGFAALYMRQPDGIANLLPQNLLGAFFFSVETLATVGYGDMHPVSTYAHIIATTEMFVGTVNVAVFTGLIFARFSKPRSRIMFANSPLISVVNGQPTLLIRTANARHNFIVDVQAKLSVLYVETSVEGTVFRRIHDLKLIRNDQPMFFLGWTVMHVIDETSPLYGMTADDLAKMDLDMVLILQGLDESTTQQMQARQVYSHRDIKWNHRYIDSIYIDADGVSHVDNSLFHETEAISPVETSKS